MTLLTSQELPPSIYSEAVVRPASGCSLLRFKTPITSQNVEQFHVDAERISLAAQQLEAQGFEVLAEGQISITIRGSPDLYEQVFKAKLTTQQRPVIKAFGCQTTGTFISAVDADRFGFLDVSQSDLAEVLDGVAINEPIYYFDAPLPAAEPPCPPYWHLTVPEGVARGLNAEQAHSNGLTGYGVKVVMVDTGWCRHPFFEKQQYHGRVVRGPGVDDCEDSEGHGTGESANLFAVAPDIDFTMVKADVQIRDRTGNVNSIAALKTAISLQPHIISCSWGTNCDQLPLSPYEQILEATIADAIRQGIIVVFAAGNGHCGFPAQHPEVIAAGGVYMDRDGSLEASDYTSGFVSPIYPERFVPDVCGLVGKPPRAAYIMLPVPPGSWVDQQLGSQGVRYPDGDETAPDDGWAAFSGTSAAAPQVAGVCALIKQANPELTPAQAKEILQQTARDVCRGCCSRYTGSKGAGVGFDLATGYGLVNAVQAVMKAQSEIKTQAQCKKLSEQRLYQSPRMIPLEEIMDSTLQSRMEDIRWRLDEALRKFMAENPQMPQVEICDVNFAPRSPLMEAAAVLRSQLEEPKYPEDAVSAAEGLLRIGRYQKRAIEVLSHMLVEHPEQQYPLDFTQAMQSCINTFQHLPENDEKSKLRSRILQALGRVNSQTKDRDDWYQTEVNLGSGEPVLTSRSG